MEIIQTILTKRVNGCDGQVDIHAICPTCGMLKAVFVGQEEYGIIKYRPNSLLDFGESEKAKLPKQLCGSCEREEAQTIH